MIMTVFILKILYILLLVKMMDTLKKDMEINTQFSLVQIKNEVLTKQAELWNQIKNLMKEKVNQLNMKKIS